MRTILLLGAVLVSACAPAVRQPPLVGGSSAAPASAAEQVVQTQLEAYNRGDLDAFLATYAPDVRIFDHPDRLRLSGLDQLRRAYGQRFAANPKLHARVSTRMVEGNYVIDHEHVTGLSDGTEIYAVAIYEVREGRIQNVWFIR